MSAPDRGPRAGAVTGRLMAAALLLAGVLVGCSSGGGEIRYYLLDAAPGPQLRDGDVPLSVRLVDLDVPQYLERFQLARRTSSNRIDYELNEQWGEPLRENLLRTLAANLSGVLATVDVSTPLARLASQPDIAVQVHVERFEPDGRGRVRLEAHWQLTEPATGTALHTERAALEADADDPGTAAEVRTMQQLLGELGDRIGASIVAALGTPEARG